MDSFISLKTWGGQSSFSYSKSELSGITIKFGDGFTAKITMEEYVALIQHFQGQTVNIGTSRTDRPPGSVGEWLHTYGYIFLPGGHPGLRGSCRKAGQGVD